MVSRKDIEDFYKKYKKNLDAEAQVIRPPSSSGGSGNLAGEAEEESQVHEKPLH